MKMESGATTGVQDQRVRKNVMMNGMVTICVGTVLTVVLRLIGGGIGAMIMI